MALTYEQAERVLQASMAKAEELGVRVSIAVTDDMGELVALCRMTGARRATPDVAAGKARVSALMGGTSADVAGSQPERIALSLTVLHGGRLVYWQGAVPIRDGDTAVGAVGVSGAPSAIDEQVALAGAEAFGTPRF